MDDHEWKLLILVLLLVLAVICAAGSYVFIRCKKGLEQLKRHDEEQKRLEAAAAFSAFSDPASGKGEDGQNAEKEILLDNM